MIRTTVKISGMACSMCEAHINDTIIRRTFSVEKVSSSHTKGETVILSREPLDEAALRAAINATGYTAGGDQRRSLREERLFPFREEETVRSFRCRHRGHRFDIYILYRRTIIMKKLGLFVAGVLFGTAGIKLLGSKDAKKVYAHTTAAALRAKEGVMKTVTAVREGADDIYAEAKAINERRAEAEAAAVVEDASAEDAKAE